MIETERRRDCVLETEREKERPCDRDREREGETCDRERGETV